MSKSTLPRYLSFANRLREQIVEGQFEAGSQLPSQRTLAEQFKTTVMTIRNALDLLNEEGLIRVEHGVGMFVVDNQLQMDEYQIVSHSNSENLQSFTASTASEQSVTEIIMINVAALYEDAAVALGLPKDASVCRIERLRRVDGQPTILQHSYVAPGYSSVIQNLNADQSLYKAMQLETKQAITSAREYLHPASLDARQSSLLNRSDGDIAWLSVRVSMGKSGVPLVYDEAWLTADSLLVTVDYFGRKNESTLHWRAKNDQSPLQYLLD